MKKTLVLLAFLTFVLTGLLTGCDKVVEVQYYPKTTTNTKNAKNAVSKQKMLTRKETHCVFLWITISDEACVTPDYNDDDDWSYTGSQAIP